MKLKKIKTVAEITDAVNASTPGRPFVEITSIDGSIKGVRIGAAHFAIDSYNFVAHVETDREKGKKWRALAKVEGFPPAVSYHDDYPDATAANAGFGDNVDCSVEHVDVWLNEAGNVMGEVSGEKVVDHAGDDLPF